MKVFLFFFLIILVMKVFYVISGFYDITMRSEWYYNNVRFFLVFLVLNRKSKKSRFWRSNQLQLNHSLISLIRNSGGLRDYDKFASDV